MPADSPPEPRRDTCAGSRVLAEYAPALSHPYSAAITAATCWLTDRNRARVAATAGVPPTTLLSWTETEWWAALVDECRSVYSSELDAAYSGLIRRAIEQVEDRLENGDAVAMRGKEGAELVRVPVKALDAAKIISISDDRLRLLRRQPTTIREDSKAMADLAQALERIADEREAQVVSVQHGSDA